MEPTILNLDTEAAPHPTARRLLGASLIAILVAVSALFAYLTWVGYQDARSKAEVSVRNLSALIASEVGARLDHAGKHLDSIVKEIAQIEAALPDSPLQSGADDVLRRFNTGSLHGDDEFFVFDASGNVRYTTAEGDHLTDARGEPWFKELRAWRADKLFVSSEVETTGTNDGVLVIGRVVTDVNGRFAGAATMFWRTSELERVIKSIDIGPHGFVAVRRLLDNSLIVCRPNTTKNTADESVNTPAYSRVALGMRDGIVDYVSPYAGFERTYAFKVLPDLPLYTVVGYAKQDYLASWLQRTILTGLAGAVLLSALIWLLSRQRRGEAALQTSTVALRRAESIAGVGHWEMDFTTGHWRWSDQTYHIYGKPRSWQPTKEGWVECLHPEDRERVLQACEAAYAGAPLDLEHRIVVHGQTRYVRAQGQYQRDISGNASYAIGTVLDITARKQAELAQSSEHVLLQQIIAAIPDHLFIKDVEGVYRHCNQAVQRFFRISEDYLIGKKDQDLFSPDVAEANRQWDRLAIRQNAPLTYEDVMVLPNGTHVLLEKTKVPLHNPNGELIGVLGIARDISRRRRAEQAVIESEARFRSLADSTPVMIWMTGDEGNGIYFNRAWLDFTGRNLEQELACDWRDDVHPDDLIATIAAYRGALGSRKQFRVEFRKRRHDGAWRWVLDTGAPRLDSFGEPIGFLGSMIDITERKEAADALEKISGRLQLAIRAARLGTFEYDTGINIVTGSDVFNELFALEAGRTVSAPELMANVHVDDKVEFQRRLERLISEQESLDLEFRVIDPNGGTRWLHAMAIASRGNAGSALRPHLYGVVFEITARKQAENSLRDVNRRLRALVACRQAMARAEDEQELLRTVCSAVVEVAGYRYALIMYREDDAEKSIIPMASSGLEDEYLNYIKTRLTWADTELGRGPIGTSIRTEKPVAARIAIDASFAPWREAALSRGFAANMSFPLLVDNRVIGALAIYSSDQDAFAADESNLLIELAQDLSFGIAAQRARAAHLAAERALRDNEQFLRDVLESTSDGILVEDREGRALAINRRFLAMWSVPSSVGSHPAGRELHAQIREQLENAHSIPARSGELDPSEQWRDYHLLEVRDGRLIARNSSPLLRDGMVAGRVWSFRDVTERRKTELLYRSVIESSPDAFVAIDEDGRIVDWSPRATQLFGWTAMEAVGRNLSATILPQAYRELHDKGLRRFVDTGQSRVIGKVLRQTAVRRDGCEFPVELQVSAVRVGKRWRFTSFIRDITSRVMAEQQLAQSQRLEAIGQLTGGLAHDFNNMLGIIIGSLDLLQLEPGSDRKEVRDLIESAQSAAHRGVEVTKSLLSVARRQALAPKLVHVDAALAEMKPLLVQTAGKRIRVSIDAGADGVMSSLDDGGFNNALLNIVINARDAMPEGGTLTVTSEVCDFSDGLSAMDIEAGRYICVTVSDTGCGMVREVVEKAFDPFFTTKDRGKGTGLGLAMVYGFARQSGGTATIDSKPGTGTVVKLYLPIASNQISRLEQEKLPSSRSLQARGERVLVVDDEFDLRQIIKENLSSAGYTVATASDPAEALQALQSEPYELLITDLVMPGNMDGAALAGEVSARFPNTRILLVSGYADEVLNGRPPVWRMLEKPFRHDTLREVVREVLDSAPTAAAVQ